MKGLKTFCITLAAVLAIGVLFLVGKGMIKSGTAGNEVTAASAVSSKSTTATVSGSKTGTTNTGTAKTDSTQKTKKKANPIVKAVVNEALDVYIENADGEVKEMAETMTEEDRETVTEIIAENVTLDSVSEMQSYLASGDKDAIIAYAEKNLSEEEIQQLTEIMSRYMDN